MVGKTINHIDQTWQYDQLQVGTFVPTVLPRGIVDTSPRSDADAASVDGEEDLPDSLQPFTDGLIERESGSPGSVGETIPKTLAPHIPAGRWNNSGGTHNLFTHFPRDPVLHYDFCKRTKIARAPCRRNRESGEDRGNRKLHNKGIQPQRITKFSMKRRIAIASSICGSGTIFGYSMDI